jgi:hypothetical protein
MRTDYRDRKDAGVSALFGRDVRLAKTRARARVLRRHSDRAVDGVPSVEAIVRAVRAKQVRLWRHEEARATSVGALRI